MHDAVRSRFKMMQVEFDENVVVLEESHINVELCSVAVRISYRH